MRSGSKLGRLLARAISELRQSDLAKASLSARETTTDNPVSLSRSIGAALSTNARMTPPGRGCGLED
jgi:hypothetical protein